MREEKKNNVILCGTITFWYLLTGNVEMKAKRVCVSGTQWKRQCKMWCLETSWYDGGRGMHLQEWEVEWILTVIVNYRNHHMCYGEKKNVGCYIRVGINISIHQGGRKNN